MYTEEAGRSEWPRGKEESAHYDDYCAHYSSCQRMANTVMQNEPLDGASKERTRYSKHVL